MTCTVRQCQVPVHLLTDISTLVALSRTVRSKSPFDQGIMTVKQWIVAHSGPIWLRFNNQKFSNRAESYPLLEAWTEESWRRVSGCWKPSGNFPGQAALRNPSHHSVLATLAKVCEEVNKANTFSRAPNSADLALQNRPSHLKSLDTPQHGNYVTSVMWPHGFCTVLVSAWCSETKSLLETIIAMQAMSKIVQKGTLPSCCRHTV